MEFLVGPGINSEETIRVSKERDDYVYPLQRDGLHVYYIVKLSEDEDATIKYNNGLYYEGKPINIKEFLDILSNLDSDDIEDYSMRLVFSICNLRRCLVELQRNFNNDCRKGFCNKTDATKQMRDFLFISIYILETLICQERYSEATDILDSLSSCSYICNSVSYKKTGCNCK